MHDRKAAGHEGIRINLKYLLPQRTRENTREIIEYKIALCSLWFLCELGVNFFLKLMRMGYEGLKKICLFFLQYHSFSFKIISLKDC